MSIKDGTRVHDETMIRRYRMPDLLSKEEMFIYFAGTYDIGIEFRDLTDDEREMVGSGVGVLPATPIITDRDREIALLRKQLGIENIEERLNVIREANPEKRDPIVELDSRTMSRQDFENKYNVETKIEAPKEESEESVGTPEVPKQTRGSRGSRGASSELDNLIDDKNNK